MAQHDQVINDGPGVQVRMDINAALAALFSSSSGPTEPTVKVAGQFWFDTGVIPPTLRYRNAGNTGWIEAGGGGAGGASIYAGDVPPTTPKESQFWFNTTNGALYLYYVDPDTSQWVQVSASPQLIAQRTALDDNLIINPAMLVSQENADTAGTATNYYAADQWNSGFVTTGVVSFGRVVSRTPKGSPYRLRATVTTAKATPLATEYYYLEQRLEGLRINNLRWGTPQARQAVLRFGFKGPAGTYAAVLREAPGSFVANFTISAAQANIDTEQIIVVPAKTDGAWATGAALALRLDIVLVAGTNFQGVAGWQAGAAILGTTLNSNGLATVNNVFELFDVGLYPDPDNTNTPPRFDIPDFQATLDECKRYWNVTLDLYSGDVTSGANYYATAFLAVSLRAAPSMSGTNSGTAGFPATVGTLTLVHNCIYELRVANGNVAGVFDTVVYLNARM